MGPRIGESIGIDSLLGGWVMPKAYSGEMWERVIAEVESGASRRGGGGRPPEKRSWGADMLWKPSPKAIQAAAEAYISDKGIKAVLEAAINVDRPIVDLSAIRTGRSRSQRTAEQSRFANELRNKRPEHFVDSRWQTFTPRLTAR